MVELQLEAAQLDAAPAVPYRVYTSWHDIPLQYGRPLVFDIETGVRQDIDLHADFDPSEAPLGNAKKEETVAKKIGEYQEKWLREGALRVEHLEILTLQVKDANDVAHILEKSEHEPPIAEQFWQLYHEQCISAKGQLIGYAIDSFDVPTLVRLAWMHGYYVPEVLTRTGYLVSDFVDLRRIWQVGDRQFKSGGALKTAKILGCKHLKTMDSGEFFGEVYYSDRPAALEYAAADVFMEWEMAEKMRVV